MEEILPKDVYLHLAESADDRTVLNMLSTNKQYNNPEFFKRILAKRYPATIHFKPQDMSWKNYYLECIYYIEKLKEDEDIKYQYTVNAKKSPKDYYNYINFRIDSPHIILSSAAEEGDIDLVDFYINRVEPNYKHYAFFGAANGNNMALVEYLMQKYPNIVSWSKILEYFTVSHKSTIFDLEYILNKYPNTDINPAFEKAVFLNKKGMIKYFLEKGANAALGIVALDQAENHPNINRVRYVGIRELLLQYL